MMLCVACCHPLGQHTRSDNVSRGMLTCPLGSTYGRMTLGMACHYFLCETHIGDAGYDISSSPLGSTHDRTTSGVAYHHRHWIAYMVRRRRAWHAILTLDKIYGRTFQAWNSIISLGQHTRSNDIGRGMPSSHLDNIHGQKNSGMVYYHPSWIELTFGLRRMWQDCMVLGLHTIGRCRASHAFFSLAQHARLKNVKCDIPSLSVESTL